MDRYTSYQVRAIQKNKVFITRVFNAISWTNSFETLRTYHTKIERILR
jgi:hypothetical protein